MTTPAQGVKMATDIAQNQYMISILFVLLLAVMIWGGKLIIDRQRIENKNMDDKNDLIMEKVENLHQERQEQLKEMMVENKKESKEREAQLMEHNNTLLIQLQSQTASLEEINRTQASMQETQASMQETQEKMQQNVSKIEQRLEKIEANNNKDKEM